MDEGGCRLPSPDSPVGYQGIPGKLSTVSVTLGEAGHATQWHL